MKILVLQLARFGDIFLSWPVLRALKRRHPGAEIHLVTRERFQAAAEGCESVDRLWTLPSKSIIEPLFDQENGVKNSLYQLTEWLENLQHHDYDLIINLSFSPLSSYLSSVLQGPLCKVRGYSRSADGYLAIEDDASAYFYAQVGIDKFNRYHLADLFAAVAQLDLEPSDWQPSSQWNMSSEFEKIRGICPQLNSKYIVIHLGASQTMKTLPPFKWSRVIQLLLREFKGGIVLIGTEEEKAIVEQIKVFDENNQIANLLGSTNFAQTAAIIQQAEVLVGGDSAPIHIASLTQTPCLNLSFRGVNFWETGPRSRKSRILFAESPESLPSERVAQEILAMCGEKFTGLPVILRVSDGAVGYEIHGSSQGDFEWQLINAIYSGGEWPILNDALVVKGLWQIREALRVAIDQLDNLNQPQKSRLAIQLIEQSDSAIRTIGHLVPSWRPLIAWFETEKTRLGPATVEELNIQTKSIYGKLAEILNMYLSPIDKMKEANS